MKTLRNVVASNLKDIVTERLVLNKSTAKEKQAYKYHPKNRYELRSIIIDLLKERGPDADLNDIDVSEVHIFEQLFYDLEVHNIDLSGWNTSKVTNMYGLFENCTNFESANIANWDTSQVTDMRWMFTGSKFNEDISKWNVSNVNNMYCMFNGCENFNCDLSKWDVSKVTNMACMFNGCENFNCDLSKWDVSNVTEMQRMFDGCRKFNSDLSKWNVSNVRIMYSMFDGCRSLKNIPGWYVQ